MIPTSEGFDLIYRETDRRYYARRPHSRGINDFTLWDRIFRKVKKEYEEQRTSPGRWRTGPKHKDPVEGAAKWLHGEYKRGLCR